MCECVPMHWLLRACKDYLCCVLQGHADIAKSITIPTKFILLWQSLILLYKTIPKCMETQMCGNVLKQVQFLCLSFYTQQGVCFSHQRPIPNQDT